MAESNACPAADKKLVLLVEDEVVNREMLGFILQDQYELLCAETGETAINIICAEERPLSLVLLDLNLPDLHGLDILRRLKQEGRLDQLPVIVLTADKEAEVESLTIGASDFIPKPYPRPEVILARVKRTIELSEGRFIIGQTERDPLTGLYNREFFYRYAEQYDARRPDQVMDAIVVNVNHFHLINERYGRPYGDEVLRRIAEKARALVHDEGGLACRREADTFLIYCPHRSDYTDMLDAISDGAAGAGKAENVVRLRMGVYPRADRSLDIERRFDRAKLASDTVRSTFTKAVAIYDSALHESAIFAEQLLIDFPKAIEEGQFLVHYQPKYDIRGDQPVLNSAEALVRWQHPEFGMISPGIFIPLFEQNGLIQQLDSYVWRAAAAQMRDWRDRLGIFVPVSVNVSRVDMYDPNLVQTMQALVREHGLAQKELMLEVTESAYTEDSNYIIQTVEGFRNVGFFIEMDDFGSGYSSLNMLSTLPIDALKLDMQFIRNAFKNGKNTKMLAIVIEIAASLSVPVIAEGVETAEQLFTLKAMGCDIVQGYYFSKPVPPDKFEAFLLEKKKTASVAAPVATRKLRSLSHDRFTYEAMHDPLTGLYNHSGFDLYLQGADLAHTALVLADIDGFDDEVAKEGRATGEQIVRRAAEALKDSFRSSDCICRICEDEFAVILSRVDSAQRDTIFEKIRSACDGLRAEKDGVPAVSLSVGVAFGDRENPSGDIFHDADIALNRAKKERQSRCEMY